MKFFERIENSIYISEDIFISFKFFKDPLYVPIREKDLFQRLHKIDIFGYSNCYKVHWPISAPLMYLTPKLFENKFYLYLFVKHTETSEMNNRYFGGMFLSFIPYKKLPKTISVYDSPVDINVDSLIEVTSDNFPRICKIFSLKYFVNHDFMQDREFRIIAKEDFGNVDYGKSKTLFFYNRERNFFIPEFLLTWRTFNTRIDKIFYREFGDMITNYDIEKMPSKVADFYKRNATMLDLSEEEIAWIKGEIRVPEFDKKYPFFEKRRAEKSPFDY